MTVAVVPVKSLAVAKSRLARRLPDEARRRLVVAMLEDVLAALSAVSALRAVWVVGCDAEIGHTARSFGAEWLAERESTGYNEAVAGAAQRVRTLQLGAMLVVPADIPGLTAHEVNAILAALPDAPVAAVLVPSADGRGTNAALLAPATAFPLRFGEPSFDAHCASARAHGVATAVVHLAGAALDIDTPDDLRCFAERPSATRTSALLQHLGDAEPRAPASTVGS